MTYSLPYHKRTFFSVTILLSLILPLSYTTFPSSTIKCNKVCIEPEQCFNLNFEIQNNDNITTAVITFSFDPGKMQIGCIEKFNPVPPDIYVYNMENPNSNGESPIILSPSLQLNFEYKLAIYPEGVYTVAIWGGNTPIPSGPLFSVPAKLLPSAQNGDELLIDLYSEWHPVVIERELDEGKTPISLYSSFATENALPIYPVIIDGTILVSTQIEGEGTDGEGAIPEGSSEGTTEEGDNNEGMPNEGMSNEGIPNEGMSSDGEINEGINEGVIEGNDINEGDDAQEDEPSSNCGCNSNRNYAKNSNLLLFCLIIGFLTAIKKL
ncbi:MAG: hypothetical protein N3G21_00695 [Candidatus Hydrogenedentes bacterium]|nr:hypothetical protein [Candidatus Hydrogenedentota bacterium]